MWPFRKKTVPKQVEETSSFEEQEQVDPKTQELIDALPTDQELADWFAQAFAYRVGNTTKKPSELVMFRDRK